MDKIAKFHAELADERIKQNVDYAMSYKYGKAHLLCCEVFKDRIVKMAAKHKIDLATIATYNI